MRSLPDGKYFGCPCSYVATASAYQDRFHTVFTGGYPDGLKQDGYLTLEKMNKYIRASLPIQKKTYFPRKNRPLLKDFLKNNTGEAVICVLGHCIYAKGEDYISYFDNDNDPVVCVWTLGARKEP